MLFILLNYQLGLGARSPESTGTGQFPPSVLVAPVLTQNGSLFTSSRGSWTNLPTGYAYSWYIDSNVTGGQTGSGLAVTSVPEGSTVYSRVAASNATGTGYSNSNSIRRGYSQPANTVAPVASSGGSQFTSTRGTWTGTVVNYTYQWQSDGADIPLATGSGINISSLTEGTSVRCVVGAINPDYGIYANSNALAVAYSTPTNTVAPVVSLSGSSYYSTRGTWTGTITGYTYNWFINGTGQGATETGSGLATAGLAEGANVYCRVGGFNPERSGFANSNTVVAGYATPVNTVAPTIIHSGETFAVSGNGTWTNTVQGYRYQWYVSGSPYGSATGSTLQFGEFSQSADVYCRVGAYNPGATGYANSNVLDVPVMQKIAVIGDSIAGAGDSGVFGNSWFYWEAGMWAALSSTLNQRVDISYRSGRSPQYAKGGMTVGELINDGCVNDAAASDADTCVFMWGTNNAGRSDALSLFTGQAMSGFRTALNSGKNVIVCDILPLSNASGNMTGYASKIKEFNSGLDALAVIEPKLIRCRWNQAIDAGNSGFAYSGLYAVNDGVHPSYAMWPKVAPTLAAIMNPLVARKDYYATGNIRGFNPNFSGTGTVPSGFTVTPSAAVSVSSSLISRGGSTGNWWQVDVTSTGVSGSFGYADANCGYISPASHNLAAGDIIEGLMEFEEERSSSSFGLYMGFEILTSTGNNYLEFNKPPFTGPRVISGDPVALINTGMMRTPVMTIPPSTTHIRSRFLVYGTGKVRVGRLGFNKIGHAALAAPNATVAPTISSGADRYHVSNGGTWVGQVDGTTYQWYKNSTVFGGQTGTGLLFTGLTHNDSVYCRVTKYNADATGYSDSNVLTYLSNTGSAPVNTVAPTIATDNGSYYVSNNGTWSNSPTGYLYQWATGGNAVAGQTGTGYYATGLAQGTSVQLIVSGINSFGTGTGVSNSLSAPVFKQVYWQDNADNEDGYRLEWGTGSGVYTNTGYAAIDATGYLIPFATTGVYYVRVIAYNNVTGSSGASNVLQVTV